MANSIYIYDTNNWETETVLTEGVNTITSLSWSKK